jgi:hypothetical protein
MYFAYIQFYSCPVGNDWESSCHGNTDRGRVERRDRT